LRHRFWFGLSQRVRWSRGVHREIPAQSLTLSIPEQAQRIAALQSRYQVCFEAQFSAATCLNNYEYLDILDRFWSQAELEAPSGAQVCDVGCANFCYAPALQAFFRPRSLVGVEIEGYRLYRDGRTRSDYAAGYVSAVPGARFLVADYLSLELPADCITAWFPFVTARAILAWRLPLGLLRPQRLFERVAQNLSAGGLFIMINHGLEEAAIAESLCAATSLRRLAISAAEGELSRHRLRPAVITAWRKP
jgi:hypothetical protein